MIMSKKKILVVYNHNNFFYERLFLDFINKTNSIYRVISIPSKNKLTLKKIFYYYQFYGFYGFLYLVVNFLKSKLNNKIKKVCNKKKINYLKIGDHKKLKKEIIIIKKLDLIISCIDMKVDRELIKKPEDGWINVHCGDLRKYRGLNTPFWSMLNNEKKLTVTLHLMDIEYDKGPIVIEKKITNLKLPFFKTLQKLFATASKELIYLVSNYKIIKKAKYINNKYSKYFSEPKLKDSINFRKKGLKFI